jgi:hypothetical protein
MPDTDKEVIGAFDFNEPSRIDFISGKKPKETRDPGEID